MSGGHWNYLGLKLEDRSEYAGNIWKLLGAIEHELDWGICQDTCYECAKARVIFALEAYFDTQSTNIETAIRLLRSDESECDKCKAIDDERKKKIRSVIEASTRTIGRYA
jgi:hypothetical protein